MFKILQKKISKISCHPHSLRRWINIFFGMSCFAIVMVAGSIYYLTYSYSALYAQAEYDSVERGLFIIQHGIIGLATLLIFGVGFIWIYAYRCVLLPLDRMMIITEQIGHGRLDQIINISAPMEIKCLSESINELSVNLQEILLFVWNQTENVLRFLDHGKCTSTKYSEATPKTDIVKQNMLELQRMISEFALYDVKLDQKRVIDRSGNDSTSS